MTTHEAPPKYQHDCDLCVYLGQHENYDLYIDLHSMTAPVLLARYGSDEPDNLTLSMRMAGDDLRAILTDERFGHFRAAYVLAVERGLIAPMELPLTNRSER